MKNRLFTTLAGISLVALICSIHVPRCCGAGGTAVGWGANTYGQPGRVAVIGPEPLLEAAPSAGQGLLLTLYGQPSSNYLFEWKTNLLDAAWQPGWSWTMSNTNVWQTFEVPGTNPAQFFRALRP